MIRIAAFALLLLYTSINGVDAAHGWSHVMEAAHEHGHEHEHEQHGHEPCELCDWESVLVPEPTDPPAVPGFMAICVPLVHSEAAEHQLNALLPLAGWADRGPPEND